MSDLPERLREAADPTSPYRDVPWWWDVPDRGGPALLLREAADDLERMRAALVEIEELATAAMPGADDYGVGLRGPVQRIARRGLGHVVVTDPADQDSS